ncbi:MAG: DUF6150 family protein [Cytophagales bacterium]|nr:DUF6150 family protein [Cytophagales bacterium]
MKISGLLKFFLICLGMMQISSAQAQPVSPCQVFGKIFYTKTKQEAQVWVYVEDSEGLADLIVYKEENELFADKAGLWCKTAKKKFADYRVYITDNPEEAHFCIFYTDEPDFAGCQD